VEIIEKLEKVLERDLYASRGNMANFFLFAMCDRFGPLLFLGKKVLTHPIRNDTKFPG
jgi:hypothetical protein